MTFDPHHADATRVARERFWAAVHASLDRHADPLADERIAAHCFAHPHDAERLLVMLESLRGSSAEAPLARAPAAGESAAGESAAGESAAGESAAGVSASDERTRAQRRIPAPTWRRVAKVAGAALVLLALTAAGLLLADRAAKPVRRTVSHHSDPRSAAAERSIHAPPPVAPTANRRTAADEGTLPQPTFATEGAWIRLRVGLPRTTVFDSTTGRRSADTRSRSKPWPTERCAAKPPQATPSAGDSTP